MDDNLPVSEPRSAVVRYIGIWLSCWAMIAVGLSLAALTIVHAFIFFVCFVEWSLSPLRGFWSLPDIPSIIRFIMGAFGILGIFGATHIANEETK